MRFMLGRGGGGKLTFTQSWGPQKFACWLFLSSRQQQLVTHCMCVSACVTAGRAKGGEKGVEEEEPAPLREAGYKYAAALTHFTALQLQMMTVQPFASSESAVYLTSSWLSSVGCSYYLYLLRAPKTAKLSDQFQETN